MNLTFRHELEQKAKEKARETGPAETLWVESSLPVLSTTAPEATYSDQMLEMWRP